MISIEPIIPERELQDYFVVTCYNRLTMSSLRGAL